MRKASLVVAVVLLVMPGVAKAQRGVLCPEGLFFAFQVDAPARYVGLRDSNQTIALSIETGTPRNVIQFEVDATGKADHNTFKALRAADTAVVNRAYAGLMNWKFMPAKLGECTVPQIVQLSIK